LPSGNLFEPFVIMSMDDDQEEAEFQRFKHEQGAYSIHIPGPGSLLSDQPPSASRK
jgi:hypothetical protein